MKNLTFPSQSYTSDNNTLMISPKSLRIGLLELLWTCIVQNPNQLKTSKEHRLNKELKVCLKAITRFKDSDEDSRVALEGSQSLILENEHYEFLKQRLEAAAPIVLAAISEQYLELIDIVNNPTEPNLKLLKES